MVESGSMFKAQSSLIHRSRGSRRVFFPADAQIASGCGTTYLRLL